MLGAVAVLDEGRMHFIPAACAVERYQLLGSANRGVDRQRGIKP
jgi:hypothetical protein